MSRFAPKSSCAISLTNIPNCLTTFLSTIIHANPSQSVSIHLDPPQCGVILPFPVHPSFSVPGYPLSYIPKTFASISLFDIHIKLSSPFSNTLILTSNYLFQFQRCWLQAFCRVEPVDGVGHQVGRAADAKLWQLWWRRRLQWWWQFWEWCWWWGRWEWQ